MKDARVRFTADGPNGPVFVRYSSALMTWTEFVHMCYGYGLNDEFITQYVESLDLEEL